MEFFFFLSDDEGPRSKFKQEDGQTDSEKMACAGVCDATLPSCKVMRAILNVQDQPEWGLCEYVIVHTILPPSPVILLIWLGGKPKWLPLKFG